MKNREKTVVALGYFDSVHIGHRKVLKRARELADQLSASFTVFTFSGDLRGKFNDRDCSVYSENKREQLYKELGADNVCFAPLSNEFLALNGNEFLEWLNEKCNVVAYVCGKDYKYGKGASCDVKDLIVYANAYGQKVEVLDIISVDKQKVSTSLIKELLKNGRIEKANALLGRNYSVSGIVVKGKGEGKNLGFPTANLKTEDSLLIKEGVYSGSVYFKDKVYKGLINLGARPTFSQDESGLEVHLIDFIGDLYGEIISVSFERFLREIVKFESIAKLKLQIEKDKERVVNGR